MQDISLARLSIEIIPIVVVLGIFYRWQLNYGKAIYAISRMLLQLLLIGYVLVFIFEADKFWIVLAVLVVMISVSSWIAMGVIGNHQAKLYRWALLSILIGGGTNLLVVTQGVLMLHPWYEARYMVPLAGMIFANSMNTLSLAAERLHSELSRNNDYNKARNIAFQTSLIPVINSLFAVGVVSLPGMMTGQILSGVSPLVAVRYQIVVMCMIFSSAGISSALFLVTARKYFEKPE